MQNLIIGAALLLLLLLIIGISCLRECRQTNENWGGTKIKSLIKGIFVEHNGILYDGSKSRITQLLAGGNEINALCIMNGGHWFEVYALKESNGETTIKVTPISQNKALNDWYQGDVNELKEALFWGSNEPSAVSLKS